jgi:hypothetical protein
VSKRRVYSPEFKRDAVELTQTPSVTIEQIVPHVGYWREVVGLDPNRYQGMAGLSDLGSEQTIIACSFIVIIMNLPCTSNKKTRHRTGHTGC